MRKIIVGLAAVLSLAQPALADPARCTFYPVAPPANYLAEGQRLDAAGMVRRHIETWGQIHQLCQYESSAGSVIRECAYVRADGSCDLYLTRQADLCGYHGLFVALNAHGTAHCGGWPRHHPPA